LKGEEKRPRRLICRRSTPCHELHRARRRVPLEIPSRSSSCRETASHGTTVTLFLSFFLSIKKKKGKIRKDP